MSEHDAPTITELMTVNSRQAKNNRQLRAMNAKLVEALEEIASKRPFATSSMEDAQWVGDGMKEIAKAALAAAKEVEDD